MPEYSTGMSHPPNGTILAPDARCRALSGVFLRGASVTCSMRRAARDAEQVTVLCSFAGGQESRRTYNTTALTATNKATPSAYSRRLEAPATMSIGAMPPSTRNTTTAPAISSSSTRNRMRVLDLLRARRRRGAVARPEPRPGSFSANDVLDVARPRRCELIPGEPLPAVDEGV